MTDERIYSEIADKKYKRNHLAETYKEMIRDQLVNRSTFDWPKINAAIIERWSISGLVYIKERAWKILDQENKARAAA
jgi:hypothetical protein